MRYNLETRYGSEKQDGDPPRVQRVSRPPIDQSNPPLGYPWPASRLTREDMMKLTELRNLTGKPITLLLHEAVSSLHGLLCKPTGGNNDA